VSSPFLAPERDWLLHEGRPKEGATQFYGMPGINLTTITASAGISADTDYYSPFYVRSPVVVDVMAFDVASGVAGNARVGIYCADANWQPVGAPLTDSGDIDVTASAVKTYTLSTPLYLPRGRYLTVYNASSAASLNTYGALMANAVATTMGGSPFSVRWRVGRSHAAFPTPGTAWTTTSASNSIGGNYPVLLRLLAT
jgi:hypothetical protein